MKIEDLPKGRIGGVDIRNPDVSLLLKELLDCRAKLKDNDINTFLLYDLIEKYVLAERKLKALNRELLEQKKLIDADLVAAGEIQKSLLPRKNFSTDKVDVAWRFMPCEKTGGDIFDIIRIDDDRLAVYMLDVAGHGVPAAMIAVCASQFLHSLRSSKTERTDPGSREVSADSPSRVLNALEKEFPFSRFENFFTVVYLVIDSTTRKVTYASAGHPPPVLLRSKGGLEILEKSGPAIGTGEFNPGAGENGFFADREIRIEPGDKLFLFTDGVVEYENRNRELYGNGRFFKMLEALKAHPVSETIERCVESLLEFGEGVAPRDDVSLLAIDFKT